MEITKMYASELAALEGYFSRLFESRYRKGPKGLDRFYEATHYGVYSGGKRFRPLLSLLTAEALGEKPDVVLPYAAAVEFIHSYSLIHDDLPCMDDDDLRRGKPTTHKVFGEALALLAGDALLTEAFQLISSFYRDRPAAALKAVDILSHAAGYHGMVGGQVLDIDALSGGTADREQVELIHALKTGALIRAAVEGAAVLVEGSAEEVAALSEFGRLLGLAFQIADDIEDHDEGQPEGSSYPTLLGLSKARALLDSVTEEARVRLAMFDSRAEKLRKLADFNRQRVR